MQSEDKRYMETNLEKELVIDNKNTTKQYIE